MSAQWSFVDAMPELLTVGEFRDFMLDGHQLRVTATSEVGCDSGRRRYRVECLTCNEVVHEATTGPRERLAFHLRDVVEKAGRTR